VDYVRPIQALVPGVQGEILAVLAATDAELTMRTVATLAGVSANRATSILNHLIELGVVRRRDVGRSALVTLDRENEVGRLIVALSEVRDSAIARMRELARFISPAPVSLVVFGSFARGTAGIGSDVDVVAVRPSDVGGDQDPWMESLGHWTDKVTRLVGNPVRLVLVGEGEVPRLLRQSQSMWADALEEGIVLCGVRLDGVRPST
jgi:predicted nucleotidyltransferase/predicted transcriptional regulator